MKKTLLGTLILIALTACNPNQNTPSSNGSSTTTSHASKSATDTSESTSAKTDEIIKSLIPATNDPDCKIPKTDYQTVSCFYPYGDLVFLAENVDENYNSTARDLIDGRGQKLLDLLEYDAVDFFVSHGLIAVMKDDKVGYINTRGELVIPPVYDSLINPENKYDESWANPAGSHGIIVSKNGKYGIINHRNETVLPFDYDNLEAFNDDGLGLYFDYDDTPDEYGYHELAEWGIIDYQGKQVKLSDDYEGSIGDFAGYDGFQEGLLGVFDDAGKYGFVDKDGKVVIPLEYNEIRSFSEGLAGVMKDGQWGFIDKNNQTIIPFNYPDDTVPRYSVNFMGAGMFVFGDGVAEVSTNTQDKTACIDKNANPVQCQGGFNH